MSNEELPENYKAANHDTWRHINRVQQLISVVIKDLLDRAIRHDQSKLVPPEVGLFAELTPKLANVTYGSPQYQEFLNQLKPALSHHYARNSHHPEHYKHGIEEMSLFDLMEMICDWKASSERHIDGNIRKSIEVNSSRFDISPQLRRILENTAAILESKDRE